MDWMILDWFAARFCIALACLCLFICNASNMYVYAIVSRPMHANNRSGNMNLNG